MRTQLPVIRYLVMVLALVFSTGTVAADSRSEAKAHYQAGVKLYNAADYKGAIKEFSAAQELLPADLNNYNLALCYDKLGEPEPAIQYYRAFLDKQPASDKRTEIEASISRLENASRSAAAKKAAKEKEEQAKRDAEAKKAEEEARKADEAKKAEELKAEETKKPPEEVGVGVGGAVGVGSTGTPGGNGTVSTGDSQLDRVSRINVDQIRDQRMGGAGSGMPDTRTQTPGMQPSGAGTGGNAAASIDVGAHAGGGVAATNPNAATPPPASTGTVQQPGAPDPSDKPKATPVYKKWWFWAVVAVSAYVVYSIATEDSNSNNNRAREMFPPVGGNGRASTQPGGLTLMSW